MVGVVARTSHVLDRALLDEGLDATDVVPVMMGQPDFGELQSVLVDRSEDGVGLRRIDDSREPSLDDEIRVVVAQARNWNHLHRANDKPQPWRWPSPSRVNGERVVIVC